MDHRDRGEGKPHGEDHRQTTSHRSSRQGEGRRTVVAPPAERPVTVCRVAVFLDTVASVVEFLPKLRRDSTSSKLDKLHDLMLNIFRG